ncbi:deoxyuridine 5'-triphosphate nucleotidohydrolase [Candidatus Bipolaricaulota bacterium]|nr:deoxyuridine 5'-triphosphate nucleotidohydrolase [Candidatus Bipolaricaulota bacterium]MCF7890902.1 deoxyuridine 5'-triphosphate nucleotidohydrolase [Candidatus Bipolaricaulota bacterium]
MIISGEGYVENFVDESVQRQGAGVDLTMKKIERFTDAGRLDFDNSSRRIASGEDISGEELEGGNSYRVTYNEKISVPENALGLVFPRSSLLRNGCHLVTAVWDPGYEGRGQGLLQVLNPKGVVLEEDARIGQIVFFQLKKEARKDYNGRYQGENC